MSLLKAFAIATAVVVGLSNFANAASRQHHQAPRQDIFQPFDDLPQMNGHANRADPYIQAPTSFQDQFRNY